MGECAKVQSAAVRKRAPCLTLSDVRKAYVLGMYGIRCSMRRSWCRLATCGTRTLASGSLTDSRCTLRVTAGRLEGRDSCAGAAAGVAAGTVAGASAGVG
jgi:hypothetical protein